MAPLNRDQPPRAIQPAPNRNNNQTRRPVPIQPRETATSSRSLASSTQFHHQRPSDSIPVRERERTLSFNDLSFERQQRVNELSRRLSSWEALAINAAARGESLPQTRQRAMNSLIRAVNLDVPLETSPPPTVATHTRRIHNPEPRSADSKLQVAKNNQGTRYGPSTAKSNVRKRDGGKAVSFDLEQERSSDRYQKWFDVVDVEWKDRRQYCLTPQTSTEQHTAGEGSSRKKRKDVSTDEMAESDELQ